MAEYLLDLGNLVLSAAMISFGLAVVSKSRRAGANKGKQRARRKK